LYYYRPDTATRSLVSGGLARLWPPLTRRAHRRQRVTGKLTVVHDAHGDQVGYSGHLLHLHARPRGPGDRPGFQNFIVATSRCSGN
jgi:predicted lipoprotein with Yx(FWY)xxD motif